MPPRVLFADTFYWVALLNPGDAFHPLVTSFGSGLGVARLVTTDDKMIPPPAQRFMSERAGSTVVEAAGSHAIYVSQPKAVAKLIERAAKGVKVAAN